MISANHTVGQDKCGAAFYSGYSDREEEGQFVNINTDEEMGWTNWGEGQPDNLVIEEDCSEYRIGDGKNYDVSCTLNYCPNCRVKKLTKFQLGKPTSN